MKDYTQCWWRNGICERCAEEKKTCEKRYKFSIRSGTCVKLSVT